MFSNLKQLFNRNNKDLRKRIYFTLFCLAVFSFGSTITVPWANTVYEELGFLEIFNLMTGGGLSSFSIFALGVTPYITAQIITQLLQMDIIPYFKELKEQGYTGKQKINQITRYLGVAFAFIQGYIFTIVFSASNDWSTILKTTVVLTAGTCLLLWIGDQITKRGIGNGLSLLIMAGILQSMPSVFVNAFNELVLAETFNTIVGSLLFASFVIIYLLIIVGMVWVQLAERRIPIQYANRTNSAYGGHQNFLPIKINSAGVIPVIFASTLMAIPTTVVNFIDNQSAIDFVNKYIVNTSLTGFVIYVFLIFFFGYFYTFLQMNPEEMSKNLSKSGAYIPGVRPGNNTIEYVSNVLSKLTIVGSLFLVIIAGLPILFSNFSGLSSSVTIGGTGLLIVVGVAIETYKQLESSLISRSHRAGIRR
ncbi:MAG TPA: preprotein translocase subunit SecY [Candidatus Coprovivens excrementavium]|nr:preprotein translocase subunit SecY [Candidatus Coprovivens excrementavium]